MERHRRLLVAAVVLLAAALRFGFVLRLPELPLYWDEIHYDGWARGYAHAWQAAGTSEFWPTLRTAFTGSIQKGETYSAFVGTVYALAGVQPHAVFVVQAALDTCTCWFVYGIAATLGGDAVGLLALALAALYPPFIFAAGRLQSETFCDFLFIGALRATLGRRGRVRGPACWSAGLLLALAMLARPALQYLFFPLVPLVALVPPLASRRRRVALAALFAAGFFTVIGPRLVLTDILLGHPLWSGSTDPNINAYAGIVPENLGWRTDRMSFAIPPHGELLEVLRAAGRTRPTLDDYGRAAALTWVRHPWESAVVALHKVYTVWAHPYNDSLRTFLLGHGGQRRLHQAVLLLALAGLPLALRRWRAGLPVLMAIAYVWATYLAVQIEVRYVLPALPLMICCAALALERLTRGAALCWQTRRRRLALLVAIGAALGVTLRRAGLAELLAWLPALTPWSVHAARTGAALLGLLVAAALVWTVLQAALSRGWALAAVLASAGGVALPLLVGRPVARVWHQWACPLQPGSVIRQDFELPELEAPVRGEFRIDLDVVGSGHDDLVAMVNGSEVRRFAGGPTRDDAVPPESYYEQVFAGQGRGARPWRGWYAVPIDPQLLGRTRTLRLELRVDAGADRGEMVRAFGDYPGGDGAQYDGPSPVAPGLFADTSLYRYLEAGDLRMRRQYRPKGVSRSSYFDGHAWSSDDLSPLAGRQFGRYRIFLVLLYPDGHASLY